MKRSNALLTALLLGVACCASADYGVTDQGTWPKSWPKELEPLRKVARTLEGPLEPQEHFAIPFTRREDFESAWPHLLKVQGKGAAIRLVRAPNFFLGGDAKAGVVVHGPSRRLADTPYIELVVDGEIVDLNRIALPPDTPIVDERFKEAKGK